MQLAQIIARIFRRLRTLQLYKYMSAQWRRLWVAFSLLLLTITIGVFGFMLIEDYDFISAFYMTVITLSTVGFTEVRELSDEGRIFTSLLIILNIGIFTYGIAVISSFLLEGGISQFLYLTRTLRRIKRMENHVIVCGLGRHGKQVIAELERQNIPYVAIEASAAKVSEFSDKHRLIVTDDATHDEALELAGIRRAKSVIVTITDETQNLYVVISSRTLNPEVTIITRASSEKAERKLLRAGANHVIMPERISGFYMASMVRRPEIVEFFTLLSNMGSADINFEEIECKFFKENYLGKTIRDLDFRATTGINIIGLREDNGSYHINPKPDTPLFREYALVILGESEEIQEFKRLILLEV